MKVAIIGANGQLGSDAAQAFADSGDSVFPLTSTSFVVPLSGTSYYGLQPYMVGIRVAARAVTILLT
jgi:hypothetical protein